MPRRVFVHVGLPKTGTSSIQQSLRLSRKELAALDYGVPGSTRFAQREAVWDLLGRRVGGAKGGAVPGSWQRLVEEIRRSKESAQLVSEELLVHARPRHARRIAKELEPFELNVVVTVRDLTTAVPSMWQQEVLTGATWTWRDYVDAVADPDHGAPTAGVAFWLRYDLDKVVDTWSAVCPGSRLHIVVVPRGSASPAELLDRFGEAVGLPAGALRVPARLQNVSLGPVGTELIRRLNCQLPAGMPEQERLWLATRVLRPALRNAARTGLAIPDGTFEALERRAAAMVTSLNASDHHVVGDVSDLVPDRGNRAGVDPGTTPESELLAAALHALTAVGERVLHAAPVPPAGGVSSRTKPMVRLRSLTRAAGFRLRTTLLTRADSSRGLAWAARLYLRSHGRRRAGSVNAPRGGR